MLALQGDGFLIRAVFFDLDGTLLDSKKRIPASAKTALQRCREMGVRVYFATARSPRLDQTLDWTDAEYSLFDGEIYSNGACVVTGDEVRYCFIESEAVRRCVEAVTEFENVHLSLHMPKEGYAFNFPVDESMNRGWGLEQARICALDEEAMQHVLKVLVFYDHLTDAHKPLPQELAEKIKCCSAGLAKVYVTDEGRTIQLSGKEAGKLATIESIRRNLGWEIDEIAVFGDDINDLEMIAFYPNSVAMGNGAEQVKQAAGFVTRSNDDGGIAYALERLLTNEQTEKKP